MNSKRALRFILSCEHGGNDVPQQYAGLFDSPGGRASLNSHRGYDPGAWAATRQIADYLSDRDLLFSDPVVATTTRLLVDLNRSTDNPSVWSKFTSDLPRSTRSEILQEFYQPHRQAVERLVERVVANNEIAIHLSVHSFTPRMRGQWRPLEMGLLFDPQRSSETAYCQVWSAKFAERMATTPRIRLRSNEPYAGTDDGLTTHLRRIFPDDVYCGIEIEINNRFHRRSPERQASIVARLCDAIPLDGALLGDQFK